MISWAETSKGRRYTCRDALSAYESRLSVSSVAGRLLFPNAGARDPRKFIHLLYNIIHCTIHLAGYARALFFLSGKKANKIAHKFAFICCENSENATAPRIYTSNTDEVDNCVIQYGMLSTKWTMTAEKRTLFNNNDLCILYFRTPRMGSLIVNNTTRSIKEISIFFYRLQNKNIFYRLVMLKVMSY